MSSAVIDRSLKVLAREYPDAFVRLTLGQLGIEGQGWRLQFLENPEVNIPEKRLDSVYQLKLGHKEYLLHLEFQLHHQPDMPERMFKYAAFLTESYGLPVIPVAIYLERANYNNLPQAYVVELNNLVVTSFTYQVVKLWDYYEAISQGRLKEFAPLLSMLAEKKDVSVLYRTKELILAEPDSRRRADSLSIALTVAERYFDRETLMRLFREEILMYVKESSFVQEWYNEGVEKGIEKGRIEALRGDILDVLKERFGEVDPEIIQAINQIESSTTLKSLLKMSIKVASLEEMKKAIAAV